jgi:hypothetical protein
VRKHVPSADLDDPAERLLEIGSGQKISHDVADYDGGADLERRNSGLTKDSTHLLSACAMRQEMVPRSEPSEIDDLPRLALSRHPRECTRRPLLLPEAERWPRGCAPAGRSASLLGGTKARGIALGDRGGKIVRVLWLALALTFATPAWSAEIEGVSFPESYTVKEVSLRLNNVGLLRYRYFIKAYVAALYASEPVGSDTVLKDIPKRLEIEYFYAIRAEDFAKATHRGIEANVEAETYERLIPRIEELNALYRDVQPGDRYALTYVPGVGTELALNGEALGWIEGAEFAAATFAIWLGDSPIDRSLKKQLLSPR